MRNLTDRLRFALRNAGMNQSQLASAVGVSRASVSDWMTGATKTIEGRNLTKAAEALGVDAHWLATGEGSPNHLARAPVEGYTLDPIRAWEYEEELPPGEYAFIPRLEVHLSAGHGREPQLSIALVKLQPQAFRADWIRKMGLRPAKLAAMTVRGDSMENRLHDGDSVVIDTAQVEVIDGRVYAIWYEGGERIKRLYRRPGGGLIVHSDNTTKYPQLMLSPEEAAHVRILGRVVHVSGEGGL